MVWYGHSLEGDLLGIFKVRIWSPYSVEPLNRQKLILSGHVFRQAEAMVIPLLAKKDVGNIGLE